MSELTTSFTLEYPYTRTLGPVVGPFLTALRDSRILGIRCGGRVLCPPLEFDPDTGETLSPDFVEVGPTGSVESWTWDRRAHAQASVPGALRLCADEAGRCRHRDGSHHQSRRTGGPLRSRCVTGKPVRMLRSRYTEAWDSSESPGTLPMPLQFLAGAEAEQRVRRAIQAGSPSAAELSITPVGQIVGSMNQLRPARQVVSDLVDECLDAAERIAELMEATEKGA